MKILSTILEIIVSPFSALMRLCGMGKNFFFSLGKPIFVFLIAIVITIILILYFYRDYIFR